MKVNRYEKTSDFPRFSFFLFGSIFNFLLKWRNSFAILKMISFGNAKGNSMPFAKGAKTSGEHMEIERNGRSKVYDIIKALGIIAIVLGHCHPAPKLILFVYTFHLAVFFFCAGLQFRDEKYAEAPFLLIQNRIRSMWPSYFWYMTFFTLTANFCYRFNLLPYGNESGFGPLFSRVVNNFFFQGAEILGGAMWFVPMLLAGVIFFGGILWFSAAFAGRYRKIFAAFLCIVSGAFGVLACIKEWRFLHNAHVSFLLIPVLFAGYLISLYRIDIKKLLFWPFAVGSLGVLLYFVLEKDFYIELSRGRIGSVWWFYPITFCGIYFVAYLAKVFSKIPYLSRAMAFFGRYSFDIMALHFLVIKMIDLIYTSLNGGTAEQCALFPRSYPQLWPIYLLSSLIFPPLIRIGVSKLYGITKGFFQKIC